MTITGATDAVELRLYNSWSRETEVFAPIDPRLVRIYSCGPTVYNYAHLGNLRAYVFTDTLRRTINWKGWPVNHIINITDVGHLTSDADEGEDKMELSAQRMKKDIWQIAAYFTEAFKADLAHLNIMPPTLWSTATDHIQDMIGFARALEQRGVTYELDSGLYFDTSKLDQYGHLARIPESGHKEGARVEQTAGKRNPGDFAIWRRSPDDTRRQMEWMSPWGPGAPGWHLECSVMSMKYLGSQFDIHTGGIDHREIHHCNEIAQNQAYTGSQSTGANFWMHNNFLVDRTGKMSKSKGDTLTLNYLIDAGVHPLAFRLLCISAHYRSQLEFSHQVMLAALSRYRRLAQAAQDLRARVGDAGWRRILAERSFTRGASFDYQRQCIEAELGGEARALLHAFDMAMSDDLMTPRALPVLDDVMEHRGLADDEKLRLVASMDMVLGLQLLEIRTSDLNLRPKAAPLTNEQVEALVQSRQEARKARDFARADALRDELQAASVEVMDGQDPQWSWLPRLAD